ncbi:adenylate/guanylate cyclase domain-containing protein [Sneathiella limimaris]|uniref:adenylate/guanylate cyclase domain-containing protein n=1 Tax=Sneathiella limimaris TaxID=1964213 RepID=UPI00146A42DF|nr:adenylate/guanylate cyclase domain-containing protein [Sneathiella limimaris]
MDRRLAAIMAADIVGYSARMGQAEQETIQQLTQLTDYIQQQVSSAGGRLFARAGDGFLSEFPSPVQATRCAFNIQRQLSNSDIYGLEGLQLRIGLHLADVVQDGDDLLGDGVNIAARVEGVAEPGTVVLTQGMFDQVKRNAQLTYDDLGEHWLKNISEPMRLYKVKGEVGTHSWVSGQPQQKQQPAENDSNPPDPHSLAILPFTNFSNDPDQEFFADGFTEDLITELARFRDLFVVSRNASFAYKGQNMDLRAVGHALNVAYCLEGSVRKMGDKVRISAQLIETNSGKNVWAEKYNFNYGELFDVQDKLASDIVAQVFDTVERIRKKAILSKRPGNMEAYECLLRGMENHRLGCITREAETEALKWFDLAIQKDPSYGRAYAWKACALASMATWGDDPIWNEIEELGRKGLQLDENDADCHRIIGSLALYNMDLERAKYHYQRALELLPNHSYIVGRMGELYVYMGDGETALRYQKAAAELDPLLPAYCRELEIAAHYILGEYEEAANLLSHLTQASRRALVYGIAAQVHLNNPTILSKRLQELQEIDPEITISEFLSHEFYVEEIFVNKLKEDLTSAGLRA